jgi:hypothetical protein
MFHCCGVWCFGICCVSCVVSADSEGHINQQRNIPPERYAAFKMKHPTILILICLIISCSSPRNIKCFDPNNVSSDTSYYINDKKFEGFIFPASHKGYLSISDERFTPTENNIREAELILNKHTVNIFNNSYKRQYLGSLSHEGDSLITIRLMKRGFKEECFDKIVAFGSGERYEKNQRKKIINLNTRKIEE